eukprot:scaffold285930_cov17-Tisochrysis_lutea.AAC.1
MSTKANHDTSIATSRAHRLPPAVVPALRRVELDHADRRLVREAPLVEEPLGVVGERRHVRLLGRQRLVDAVEH